MKRSVYLIAVFFYFTNYSQTFPFNQVEYIGAERGLNGDEVYGITQDKNGFIWVITDFALNRYDGYSFRSWQYNPRDSISISTGFYNGLIEDKNGVLWMPSQAQGLYSFDPYQEKFTQYRYKPNNKNSISDDNIFAVEAAPDGNIWIATAAGLDVYEPGKKVFTNIANLKKDPGNERVRYSLYFDNSNGKGNAKNRADLWTLTDAPGIDCFDPQTQTKIESFKFPLPYQTVQCVSNAWVVATAKGKDRIWIGSDHNGIHGFDIRAKQYLHIKTEKVCKSKHHLSGYHKVWEDSFGDLWTTNDENEIIYYDHLIKKFYYYPVQKMGIDFLGLVPFIWEDNGNRIWIGTNSGIIKINTRQKKIVNCLPEKNNPFAISGNMVFAIKRINDSQLLVNSEEVQVFDKKTNSFTPFPSRNNNELKSHGFWCTYKDHKGSLWFTGFPGVRSYDPQASIIRSYVLHDSSGRRVTDALIDLLQDNQGKYWAASWGEGLYLFDPPSGIVKNFAQRPDKNSISSNYVGKIFKDSKGLLYMNGWEGGFITFNPVTEMFKIYHHDIGDSNSVSNDNCHSFIETPNGLIWFATMGGGINVFNPYTQKFKAFTTADGLAHNNISSLIRDNKGQLWAGTRGGGISCFMPPTDPFQKNTKINFRNYDSKDGFSSNVINLTASFCDTDGTLYFGTRDGGMFYFHPDDLLNNNFIPPVYITELRIQNDIVSMNKKDNILKKPIEFTKTIRLNYSKGMLSFAFTALDFTHAEKNNYAYMLEDYDKDWVYTNASRRFAVYTNLSPGSYIFKVKGSNNNGIWNDIPTELNIIIVPTFWQTSWFKVLILVAIGLLFYGFYRYRLQQIKRLQTIRNNIASDLHDDIGSTLNSISIYSEVAKQQAGKEIPALEMIGTNSRKIIESMSDIVWTINPENDSFEKIIVRMRSFAHQLLKAKKVEYTFEADEKLNALTLSMQVRKNFYLVFKEAVTNLVKYSGASRVSIALYEVNKTIVLKIRDNGSGIPVNPETQGNGLMNMKRRAEEMHASLHIISAEGEGTGVELLLKHKGS